MKRVSAGEAPREIAISSAVGDYVDDLRAEMDVIAAFSNCSQIHNACNGFHLTSLKATIYEYNPA